MPDYLKAFLAQVWSRAIVAAAQADAADPTQEKRFRRAAYYLVAGIQPKRTIEQRSQFLAGLRGLTTTLDEGLALIGWPKDEHDAFFAKLMADHSGSLKATPGSELDHNMLMRQIEAAARIPLPAANDAKAAVSAAAGAAFEPRFNRAEALRLGLVDEDAVDWASASPSPAASVPTPPPIGMAQQSEAAVELDLDLATRPAPMDLLPVAAIRPKELPAIEAPLADPAAQATPAAAVAGEAEEPTEGPQLRHHLQIGASYLLRLKEQWEAVRLKHMNASRTFFLFAHGAEDRGTISMTARMLGRLCEAHRLKAFEGRPLIDRATERVRTQAAAAPASPASRAQELSTA
jgi:hypothetical protein